MLDYYYDYDYCPNRLVKVQSKQTAVHHSKMVIFLSGFNTTLSFLDLKYIKYIFY